MVEKCQHECFCGTIWSHFDRDKTKFCFIPTVLKLPCPNCTRKTNEAKALKTPFLEKYSDPEKIAILNNRVGTAAISMESLSVEAAKFEIECTLAEYRTKINIFNETHKTIKIPDNVKWYPERSDAFKTITEIPKEKYVRADKKDKKDKKKKSTKIAQNAVMQVTGMSLESLQKAAEQWRQNLREKREKGEKQ